MATTLHGFVQHGGHEAVHIRDLPCGPHAADVEWIGYLASTGADWLIITGDLRIHRNKAERLAFRQARLKGIALAPAYQKIPMHHRVAFMLWRWPEIEGLAQRVGAPFIFELPASHSSKIRSLPV